MKIRKVSIRDINPAPHNPRLDLEPGYPVPKASFYSKWLSEWAYDFFIFNHLRFNKLHKFK